MAKELLPVALWARIAPLLPPEPPKPKGGRVPGVGPGGTDGDPVRAEDGHPLGVLACRDEVWERDDVLAQAARLVPSGRLTQVAPGASRGAGPGRSHRLGPGRAGLRLGAGPERGTRNGQEPNGSRQTGHEAPSCGRRPRHPARGPGERCERARFEDDARHRRRHRAHPRQDARQAPSPTAQAPCRQGLRLPSPPSGPAQAPDPPPHRPRWWHGLCYTSISLQMIA